jgi:hypothetical protein
MNKPSLYVTFSGPGSQTFGPYASVSFEGTDHDYEVLMLLVSETSHDGSDEDGDGHCLAQRVDGIWKLGDEQDGREYTKVIVHQQRP